MFRRNIALTIQLNLPYLLNTCQECIKAKTASLLYLIIILCKQIINPLEIEFILEILFSDQRGFDLPRK